MSRIAQRFADLKKEGRGALIPYLEACDPDHDTAVQLLCAMPSAGADLIEIGVPFTDPAADGPTIQAAARRGLAAGATLRKALDMVATFRKDDNATPIILMGYLNPVEAYGYEAFCHDAAQAGVDGLIIVDFPPEESEGFSALCRQHGLDMIRLVAPTTTPERLESILRDASGFLYYVSITGITGTGFASEQALAQALPPIRARTSLPVAIGFGVRTPEQVRTALRCGDAAIVASALMQTLESSLDPQGRASAHTTARVLEHIRTLAQAARCPSTTEEHP